ncbi:hypothetical protein BKA70DRAFT_1435446 [Coprinopsis sp. MPI-PUGE-AT-0042]|nr:hypothetical protein BKA70DRAFT_1435446 [Coprinopsis sp. MPI-PUGE-AT-0042]
MSSIEDAEHHELTLTFGAFLIYTALASLHVYLCVHGLIKYRLCPISVQKTRRNYARLMLLILFLSTATFVIDLTIFFISFDPRRGNGSPRHTMMLNIVLHAFLGATHLTADGLLSWRCYVIWMERWWIGLAPLFPYLISIAVGTLNIVSSAICDGVNPAHSICFNNSISVYRGLYYLAATGVNLTATSLICLRLWRMKRQVDKAGISGRRTVEPVPYVKLTMVLIESALPFTALGISTAVLAFVDTPAANDARIFSSRLWTIASGLTAQAILYRVVSGISWTSNPERGVDGFSQSIHFASIASQIRSGAMGTMPDHIP